MHPRLPRHPLWETLSWSFLFYNIVCFITIFIVQVFLTLFGKNAIQHTLQHNTHRVQAGDSGLEGKDSSGKAAFRWTEKTPPRTTSPALSILLRPNCACAWQEEEGEEDEGDNEENNVKNKHKYESRCVSREAVLMTALLCLTTPLPFLKPLSSRCILYTLLCRALHTLWHYYVNFHNTHVGRGSSKGRHWHTLSTVV